MISQDERQKQVEKVQKLKRQAESEAKIGNEGAASLFSEKADEIMIKFNISNDMLLASSKIEEKFVNNLGISYISNPFLQINARTNLRKFWFEALAKLVANAYHCEVSSTNTESDKLLVYGYDLDRELAIFMLLKLAEVANEICKKEMNIAKENVGKPPIRSMFSKSVTEFPKTWMGDECFTDSLHRGFRETLEKAYSKHNLDEEREKSVKQYFNQQKQFTTDYYTPKEWSSLDEKVIELGRKAGEIVYKKASNSPSAIISTKSSTIPKAGKVLDVDEIYLVLDDSGSMYGEPLSQCKEGALKFARTSTAKGNAVGLIKFGTGAKHLLRPQIEVDDRFEKAVEKLKARDGHTQMHLAIQSAHAHLLNRRRKRTIVLVTDGYPSDRNSTLNAAKLAKQDGIEIATIAVEGADEEFLRLLSSREGLSALTSGSRLALTMGEMANLLQ